MCSDAGQTVLKPFKKKKNDLKVSGGTSNNKNFLQEFDIGWKTIGWNIFQTLLDIFNVS